MLKWKYILLSLSVIEFAIGFSNARPNPFFYAGLPLGATLLALSFIFHVLEKESALYDEQNRVAESERSANVPLRRPDRASRPTKPGGATWTTSHSH